ncbi:type II toxin-antitoxin system HicA family toxin [Rhizobium sullae]|uniref:type II toxin-antitoxin system HicA family toxin n=1 Tax=Rhizobium sullae TaxID=50338 RepID=UPI001FE13B2E|nr:type II toxin-antitoxin system HicA family toxin [Rhizobium sullae]
MEAIFRSPVPGTIVFADVESQLIAVGCVVIEGNASRVRFDKDGQLALFRRPHRAKEAKRYQIKDARRFLQALGIEP